VREGVTCEMESKVCDWPSFLPQPFLRTKRPPIIRLLSVRLFFRQSIADRAKLHDSVRHVLSQRKSYASGGGGGG
jgi:hypothetical protein